MPKRSTTEISTFLAAQAQRMKANPTPSEGKLWLPLIGMGFAAQYPLQGQTKNGLAWQYILDFYHPAVKLCIEVDGSSHRKRAGRDRRRDSRLATLGIATLRVTNRDVLRDIEGVLERIRLAVACYKTPRQEGF